MGISNSDEDLKNIVSTSNSTSSTLGSNATFTGAWEECFTFSTISIVMNASHDSAVNGLKIEFSTDGINTDYQGVFSTIANAGFIVTEGVAAKFFRVVFINGAIAQSFFRLQSILHYVGIKNSSHKVEEAITGDDDAELVKSVVTVRTPSGSYVNLAGDEDGNLIVTALTGFNAAFSFGTIATSSTSKVLVNSTAYTAQSVNATRSIASSSASDSSAGTGARTIKIVYLDENSLGPYETTVTLNGTSYVNTSVSNICFIERIQVLTVGSGDSNAGTLTLKAATAGGGVTIGTITAGNNQTLWAHHYVPTGKTINITGFSGGHSNTVVGGGGLFTINAKLLQVANAVDRQISDFIRVYGQSSTIKIPLISPLKIDGPAFISVYVRPETSSASTYRASFDFFEP